MSRPDAARHVARHVEQPAEQHAEQSAVQQAARHAEQPVDTAAVIALGSNQGDRERLLREAVRAIDALDGVRVSAASGIVETPALKLHGVDESAPSYLNAVILVQTVLAPEALLQHLHAIEASLGRVREEVWGDRTIDLDIIDFGGITRHNETIVLPHPRAWQRAFVLAPWVQVQPDAVLAGPDTASSGRIADLLVAATVSTETSATTGAGVTGSVTEYPASSLMEVLRR